MRALRLTAVLGFALLAGCQDREPAVPALRSVQPPAARVLAPLTLQLAGENLNARSQVDFQRGVAEPTGDYAIHLESASGQSVDLSAFTRTSATAATAVLTPPIQPGRYAVVLVDPWGRTSRLEGGFRALDACERADGSGPHPGDACDGDDADLCPDDTWECVGETLVCSHGADNVEVCDGLDNDCDGTTPDGSAEATFGDACDGLDSDLCKEGKIACNGTALVCDDATGDTLDVCDGVDNDCNPATADGSGEPTLGTACDGNDTDRCTDGVVVCNGAAGLGCNDDATGIPDLCDGIDNDCNPATPDGADEPTLGNACDGNDTDRCTDGVIVCSGGVLGCNDDATGIPDLCDGIDNDCNPATADGSDEPTLNQPCDGPDSDSCNEGVWACSGTLTCTDNTADGCPASVDVGTFRKTTGPAGTLQDVPHNLGDVPKALILWTDGSNATGYLESYRFGLGFTDERRVSGAASAASANYQLGGVTARRVAGSALTIASPWQATLAEATLESWDASKLTLRWTVNDPGLTDVQIHYLALSGQAVRSSLVNWQTRTSIGTQPISGMGFQPQLVLHTHVGSGYTSPVGTTSTLATSGIGAMDGTRQWAASFISGTVAPTETAAGLHTSSAILMLNSGATVAKEAAYASMDPSGFSVSVNPANTSASQVYSLGIAGLNVRADCFLQTASVSSQPVTGVGFRPAAVLFASIQYSAPAVASNVNYSLGGADADAQAAIALTDEAGLLTTQVETVTRPGSVYVEPRYPPFTGSDGALARISSFDADGFTVGWTLPDAQVTQICYVAFGL